MNFGNRKNLCWICLCLVLAVSACQGFLQGIDRAGYNEVETLYVKGVDAKRAGKSEEAYRYFLQAYTTSSNKGGIIRFPEDPQKNNYRYTYSLISRKMDETVTHITVDKLQQIIEEEKQSNSLENTGTVNEGQQSVRKVVFKNVITVNEKITEAEEFASWGKYLEAIQILEKFIEDHRNAEEAYKARKLIMEYEERQELYDAVGRYLKENNYPMARKLLLKMKKTYLPKPEFEEALAYIDKLLDNISGWERENKLKRNTRQKGQKLKP